MTRKQQLYKHQTRNDRMCGLYSQLQVKLRSIRHKKTVLYMITCGANAFLLLKVHNYILGPRLCN